jgi:uridine phosphorylase
LIDKLSDFKRGENYVANFEMESSAIYGLGRLMGHHCISLNVIVANRLTKEFSEDSNKSVERLIEHSLNILDNSEL